MHRQASRAGGELDPEKKTNSRLTTWEGLEHLSTEDVHSGASQEVSLATAPGLFQYK
jgi:hypothetical protein